MATFDTLVAQPPPMKLRRDGVWRVGGTRVTLDSVIHAFNNGSSAEEILLKYPSLNLTDIYAVITYYLWHRSEIDAYLKGRQREADEVRLENERRFPRDGVRERLLSRRSRKL